MNKKAIMDDILIRYLTGSATEEERDQARQWIKAQPENLHYFEELKNCYQLSGLIRKPSGYDKSVGWDRIRSAYFRNRYVQQQETGSKTRKRLLTRITTISAAAVIVSFLLGSYFNNIIDFRRSSGDPVYNEISVPLGSKSELSLADGTRVWLNAGSKLKYSVDFGRHTREVFLEGEAFFDVTKNKREQFIVSTSGIAIKVYGTRFNVKSYPEENLIQTTLVEGSIALEAPMDGGKMETIFLKPNQTATIFKSETHAWVKTKPVEEDDSGSTVNSIRIEGKIDPLPLTSWKDQKWIIAGEALGELAIQLERRYNVKIAFENENLKNYKFSGTLTNETFEQVVKIIQISAPITFSIEGNSVMFKEDPPYKQKYDRMIRNKIYAPMETK